jgi:hypothetical protein
MVYTMYIPCIIIIGVPDVSNHQILRADKAQGLFRVQREQKRTSAMNLETPLALVSPVPQLDIISRAGWETH